MLISRMYIQVIRVLEVGRCSSVCIGHTSYMLCCLMNNGLACTCCNVCSCKQMLFIIDEVLTLIKLDSGQS